MVKAQEIIYIGVLDIGEIFFESQKLDMFLNTNSKIFENIVFLKNKLWKMHRSF